jgi:rRNA processing protein Krr1/Pno1
VPKALLGKVIGKQASTIIEIREKSGCYRVDARDQTSDPCQVKVAGTAGAVRMAKALIAELLAQTKKVNDGATVVEVPRAQIGKVMGMKGAQVGQIQKDTNTKIDFDFESDPCKCFIKGEPNGIERAKKFIQTITMQIMDEASEYLDYPKNVSGILIGTKGSRIRYLQETSGARIDLDKNGPTCKVRLAGSREAVDMAKFLIESELEKNMTPTRSPGATQFGLSNQGPMTVPAHQPTSFPASIDESIARARAAAEAVKHGLISLPEQAQENDLGSWNQDGAAGGGQWSGGFEPQQGGGW